MQEIEFLKHLIADTEKELEYMEQYQKEAKLAEKDNSRYAKVLWRMRHPSRQRIKDNFKMVRRITLELERRLR